MPSSPSLRRSLKLLQVDYRLSVRPLVVRNTPVRATVGTSKASVRAAAGLADEVPLLVYSGYMHPERGLGVAIQALPILPEFHLVLVSGPANAELKAIRRLARRVARSPVGCTSCHMFLNTRCLTTSSSADLGIICSKRTINYEKSLPTKFAEYMHAKLPVVVNDLEIARRVRRSASGR